MKVQKLNIINNNKLSQIMRRSYERNNMISTPVKQILENVRQRGDDILITKYRKRYGKSFKLEVNKNDTKTAYSNISPEFIKSLKQAKDNITKVCLTEKQSTSMKICNVEDGIRVWREWRAIEKVGLYIPGGKAVYPSSVLMTGIPAIIAGCSEIVLCTPPDNSGNIPSPTLIAADSLGIKKIFKVGGAEAIGAMAFGTETIPNVYKIFGAGNSYVTEAKLQVFGTVNIDMPAGPSEVFIIADDTANPAYIAADLLADGEHGEDSACVLLTTSRVVANKTITEINNQLKHLSTAERVRESLRRYGLIAIVDSLDEAIAFSNEYAPEHLEIMTRNPNQVLQKITNAGSVFLGSWTTKSSGDYATGANHVLPTGGMAKMFPSLSIESFGRMMQVQKVSSKKSLAKIRKTIETFGETENLPAHKNATSIRFKEGGDIYES